MTNSGTRLFADRYALDVQLNSPIGLPVWRATDTLLKRDVQVILLSTTDPRANELLTSAQFAAHFDSRSAVAVLDVIEHGTLSDNSETEYVGVITEFITGETFDQKVFNSGDAFTPKAGLKFIFELASVFAEAHRVGVTHNRLRPHNIYFADSDELRISGFGIDSAFAGGDGKDAVRQDIVALGDLLFLAVTGIWPKEPVDGLPIAPKNLAEVLKPSLLHSGVPTEVDDIYLATQNQKYDSVQALIADLTVSKTGRTQSWSEKSTAWTEWLKETAQHQVQWHGDPPREHRWKLVAGATAATFAIGWLGLQLLTSNFKTSDTPVAIVPNASGDQSSNNSASPSSNEFGVPGSTLEIVEVKSFDPFGDETENDQEVQAAIDQDTSTAWRTVTYRNQDLGKAGVGLLLDLGAPRPVAEVELLLARAGHDVAVFVTDEPAPDPTKAEKLGEITKSDENAVIKSPRAINGRYVLIWFTALPKVDDGFSGGIANVQVRL